jgi:Phosphate transporter family
VAVQWPERFRLDPDGRWDDEIKRLSVAADAFERVANVVQSTLLELWSPLESLSRVSSPIIDPPPGRRAWPSFSLLSLEQSPGIFTTWYFGLPTSSSQALIGGLVGAALASASTVHWMAGVVGKVIVPVILSPFVGFVGGYVDDHRRVGVA